MRRHANGGESEVVMLPASAGALVSFGDLGGRRRSSVQCGADLTDMTMIGHGIAPNSVVPTSPGHAPLPRVQAAARLCGTPMAVRPGLGRLSNEVLEIPPRTMDWDWATAPARLGAVKNLKTPIFFGCKLLKIKDRDFAKTCFLTTP